MLLPIIIFILIIITLYWYTKLQTSSQISLQTPTQTSSKTPIVCIYGSFVDPGLDACVLDNTNNYIRVLTQTLSTGPSTCPLINTQVINCIPINGICHDVILDNTEDNYTFSGPFLGSDILAMQNSSEYFTLSSTTSSNPYNLNPNLSYYIGTLKTGIVPGYSITPLYGGYIPPCSYPNKVYSSIQR